MAKEIHYSKDIQECPYCGHDEFYIRQSFHGTCNYNYRYDGGEADNTELFSNTTFNDTRKYAHCTNCDKRLFPIKEYYESLFDCGAKMYGKKVEE